MTHFRNKAIISTICYYETLLYQIICKVFLSTCYVIQISKSFNSTQPNLTYSKVPSIDVGQFNCHINKKIIFVNSYRSESKNIENAN